MVEESGILNEKPTTYASIRIEYTLHQFDLNSLEFGMICTGCIVRFIIQPPDDRGNDIHYLTSRFVKYEVKS